MSPWFLGATVIVGLIYLFASLALNSLKRDAVGHWLKKCRWSREASERFTSPDEENLVFMEIQFSPALFVKPTAKMMLSDVGDLGYQVREVYSGAWLQLRMPAALRGATLHMNLLSSYRPSQVMPVTALGGSLGEYLIEYGSTESIGQWGKTPESKAPAHYEISRCRALPDSNEEIIWQAWVPVDEKAKYLEVQIWYPVEILAPRSDDKGYRFQLELLPSGAYDNSESRLLGATKGSISVEKLGGRGDGVMLPIPL